MSSLNSTVHTERLSLSCATPADADALHDLFGDAEVMRWVDVGFAVPRPFTCAETENWINNYQGLEIAPWKIVLKDSGEVIGWGGIDYCPEDETPQAELLYFFKPKHWGKGYATELAKAAIEHGFGFDHIHAIEATVHQENTSSIRVLEKAGMRASGCTTAGRLIYSVIGKPHATNVHSTTLGETKQIPHSR